MAVNLDLHGLYAGASVGEAGGRFSVNGNHDTGSTSIVGAFVGNQFTPAFGAELGFDAIPGNGSNTLIGSLEGTYSYAVPSTPLKLRASAGVASTYVAEGGRYNFRMSPVAGVGAEFTLTPKWSLRTDYKVVNSFGVSRNRVEIGTVALVAKF